MDCIISCEMLVSLKFVFFKKKKKKKLKLNSMVHYLGAVHKRRRSQEVL